MVTTYDRIRAALTEPETDDTIHRYGAWFFASSDSPRVSTSKSLGLSLQRLEASGKPSGAGRAKLRLSRGLPRNLERDVNRKDKS
jgi:hypothetical protein